MRHISFLHLKNSYSALLCQVAGGFIALYRNFESQLMLFCSQRFYVVQKNHVKFFGKNFVPKNVTYFLDQSIGKSIVSNTQYFFQTVLVLVFQYNFGQVLVFVFQYK